MVPAWALIRADFARIAFLAHSDQWIVLARLSLGSRRGLRGSRLLEHMKRMLNSVRWSGFCAQGVFAERCRSVKLRRQFREQPLKPKYLHGCRQLEFAEPLVASRLTEHGGHRGECADCIFESPNVAVNLLE